MERIAFDTTHPSWPGHSTRYRLASGFVDPGDYVLDAACGVGYGSLLIAHAHYIGVDKVDVIDPEFRGRGRWIVADLDQWQPPFPFDVGVSFETIEHVEHPDRLVDTLCRARRVVLASVPIVPTAGANPYHRHDFEVDTLPTMFEARGWRTYNTFMQPTELSAVYVFTRK